MRAPEPGANPVGAAHGRSPVEGLTQVAIMLAIGGAAGAASFTHVHDVAAAHGQPGWLAWADAVVLELMSVASGLEMRRRKRAHAPVAFPTAVLVVAMALSLSAQVVDAEQSAIGWIAAAIPALGFLVMVKIALAQAPAPSHPLELEHPALPPHGDPSSVGPVVSRTPGGRAGSESEPGGSAAPAVLVAPAADPECPPMPSASAPAQADVGDLLSSARAAADALDRQGRRVSRQALADAMRARGHAVSNARASALLRMLKDEAQGNAVGVPPTRFRPAPRGGTRMPPVYPDPSAQPGQPARSADESVPILIGAG